MGKVALKEDAIAVAVPAVQSEATALISMIERAARDPNVDIDKMQRLFAMQQEATANRARTEFLAAFAKLQANLPAVERKGTAHNNKKYARFEDFIETIRKPLSEHGFSLSFRIKQENAVLTVTGVLGHEAGHQEATELPLPADKTGNKNDVQAWGSTISYGKRYVGLTLLGIATEDEDDDGQKAGAKPRETITEDQEKSLRDLMKRAEVEEQIVLERFGVQALSEMTPADLKTATAKCNKKLEMM